MRISVILPTRGRKEPLLKSIQSLLDQADEPDQVEILLGMDNDDLDTVDYVKSVILPMYPNVKLYMYPPYGYGKLNVYANSLAALSTGHWLMLWNDDALIQNKSWDTIIDGYDSHPMPLLRMPVMYMSHPFALFPIVKRKWFEIVGTMSSYVHIDRFIYNVNSNIDWNRKHLWVVDVPVTVLHDRYDLTGNNNDDTFKKAIQNYQEGEPENPLSDDYPPAFTSVLTATNKLIHYINSELGGSMPLLDIQSLPPVEKVFTQSHGAH
jgi:glycosyltransferase involved in cell wall biosynthesis